MKRHLSFILVLMILLGTISFSTPALADEDYVWIGTAGTSKSNATSIQINKWYAGDMTGNGDRWLTFTTPSTPGYCNIWTHNLSIDSSISIYVMSAIDETLGSYTYLYKPNSGGISRHLKTNTTYYIKVHNNGNKEGNYKVAIWFNEDPENNKESAVPINFDKQYAYALDGSNDYDYYSFVTPIAGIYKFNFKNITIDSSITAKCLSEIDEELGKYSYLYKGNSGEFTVELRAGVKYYFCISLSGDGWKEGKYTFTVYAPKQLVTSIDLNKNKVTLARSLTNLKPTYQLKATVYPDGASNKAVTWSSSNTKVAKVSSSGKVTALSAGTATITCTAKDGSGVVATCKITVTQPMVKKITLSKTKATLKVKKTLQLKVKKIAPADAVDKTVKWTTSNKKVATVNSKGKVTAKGIGTCVITCTAQDGSKKTAKCKITVK